MQLIHHYHKKRGNKTACTKILWYYCFFYHGNTIVAAIWTLFRKVPSLSHYFTKKQGSFKQKPFTFSFAGNTYNWIGSKGVFAGTTFDEGTKLLLSVVLKNVCINESSENTPLAPFLDLGCGTGITGLIYGETFPDYPVILSDINTWAVQCTESNKHARKLTNVHCVVQDQTHAFKADSFSNIALNPPIRTGNKNILAMFEDCSRILNKSGSLYIVVRAKQGAKRLSKMCLQWFRDSELMARNKGYLVFRVSSPL